MNHQQEIINPGIAIHSLSEQIFGDSVSSFKVFYFLEIAFQHRRREISHQFFSSLAKTEPKTN